MGPFLSLLQAETVLQQQYCYKKKLLLYFVEKVAGWLLKAKSYKAGNNVPQNETQLT